MRYVWLEVDADAASPLVRWTPLTETPLHEWRTYDRDPSDLIAVESSSVDEEAEPPAPAATPEP